MFKNHLSLQKFLNGKDIKKKKKQNEFQLNFHSFVNRNIKRIQICLSVTYVMHSNMYFIYNIYARITCYISINFLLW